MGEGGEIVEVCTVDLKCLKELLNSRGHEVRKEHEEIAERKKSVFFFLCCLCYLHPVPWESKWP